MARRPDDGPTDWLVRSAEQTERLLLVIERSAARSHMRVRAWRRARQIPAGEAEARRAEILRSGARGKTADELREAAAKERPRLETV